MDFRGADRGQSIQVGAILIFGILIVGLGMYQATVVPSQNAGVEANAYQEATADMADLRNNFIAAATRDASSGTTVTTGAAYPARTLFVNPGPPATQIETGEPRGFTLENVEAGGGESENTAAFIEQIAGDEVRYTSKPLVFTPDYHEFSGQPMVVGGDSAYRHGTADAVPLADQTLIQGNRISLVMVDGDLSASGQATTLTTEPVSSSTRTVTVRAAEGEQPVLRLDPPPGLTAEEWNDSRLSDQLLTRSNVEHVSHTADDQIRIELNADTRYKLRMSLIEVREQGSTSEVATPDPAYIIPREGHGRTVNSGSTTTITAEVRDQYNNPVAGENVEFEITGGDGEFVDDEQTAETDSDGQASVNVLAQGDSDLRIEANVTDTDLEFEPAVFDVHVFAGAGTERGEGAFLVDMSQARPGGPDGDDTSGLSFEFRNLDRDDSIEIIAVNVTRTSTDADRIDQGEEGDSPWYPVIHIVSADSDDGQYDGSTVEIGETVDLRGGDGEVAQVGPEASAQFYLYEFTSPPGGPPQPGPRSGVDLSGEFVEVTITFEIRGEELDVTSTLIVF